MAEKRHTQTVHRVAQKRQFTESLRKQKLSSGEPAAQVILPTNTIIGGTYRIVSQIGMGGMGVVYLVEQTSLHKQFALKVLSPDLVNEQNWLRFKAEAKTMAALNHPSFVNVYDLGIHAGSIPFYSMDYLVGRSLEEILADEGPLKLEQALNIFIEVLNGLAYAHRNGIIHRDIKPANIMICTTNGANQVKILDFGISKLVSSDSSNRQSMTMAGDVFGSPYYMSPEQCSGEPVDVRSDIYSIGCTLFEVLTGYVPFEGKTSVDIMLMHQEDDAPLLSDLLPETIFPRSIDAILATCLAKAPESRYQSAKELALDLERIANGKEIQASSPAYSQLSSLTQNNDKRKSKPNSRGKALTAAAMGLIALALLLGASASLLVAPPKQTIVNPAPAERASAPSLESEPKYFSRIVDEGRTIEFSFPTEQSLGRIAVVKNPEKVSGFQAITNFPPNSHKAQSKITFPINSRLGFWPNENAFAHPEIFRSFRPNDLYLLAAPVAIETSLDIRPSMKYIAKLKSLRIFSCVVSNLGDQQVTYLNELTDLIGLNVFSTDLTGKGLAELKRIKKLQSLCCGSNTEHSELLTALQGSSNLIHLSLEELPSPLSESDAHLIASCKNLGSLSVAGSGLSDRALAILADLPHLHYINIDNCDISAKAIENFKKSYPAGQITVVKSIKNPGSGL